MAICLYIELIVKPFDVQVNRIRKMGNLVFLLYMIDVLDSLSQVASNYICFYIMVLVVYLSVRFYFQKPLTANIPRGMKVLTAIAIAFTLLFVVVPSSSTVKAIIAIEYTETVKANSAIPSTELMRVDKFLDDCLREASSSYSR